MGKNRRELFQGKPTQSGRDWKPNYISASVGIRTGVLEVESEARHTNLELAYFDIKIPMEDQKQELLPLNEIKLQDNEKKTFEEVLCLFMIEKNLILLFHINQYGHKKQFNYS